jgi:putative thiamine transport system ATP-binding protein
MNIEVKELTVGVGKARKVLLRDFSLDCPPGRIITLMGPSGCGKSSLLAAIAGLNLPGLDATIEVRIAGRRLDALPTSQRRIGFLFQDDLLFAHMTVRDNLLFAAAPGTPKLRAAQVDAALAELGFEAMAQRNPATLSGGQRARVSLMRTLLAKPQALLLDEPFSKLDAALRGHFQLPTLLVTHDAADIADHDHVIDFNHLTAAHA